jgi:hypothetical protein
MTLFEYAHPPEHLYSKGYKIRGHRMSCEQGVIALLLHLHP